MTLPLDTISIGQLNAEFGKGLNLAAYRNVGWWTDGNLKGTSPTSGAVDMNYWRGKRSTSPVIAGAWDQTSPGTYTFTVPLHDWFRVRIWGAGGGGGAAGTGWTIQNDGGSGGPSSFDGWLIAYGGSGGAARTDDWGGWNGGAGGASGGSTNGTGWGNPGGAGGTYSWSDPKLGSGSWSGGNGGNGGYTEYTWGYGSVPYYNRYTVVVGGGGNGGWGSAASGNAGASGRVLIDWG